MGTSSIVAFSSYASNTKIVLWTEKFLGSCHLVHFFMQLPYSLKLYKKSSGVIQISRNTFPSHNSNHDPSMSNAIFGHYQFFLSINLSPKAEQCNTSWRGVPHFASEYWWHILLGISRNAHWKEIDIEQGQFVHVHKWIWYLTSCLPKPSSVAFLYSALQHWWRISQRISKNIHTRWTGISHANHPHRLQ